MIRLTLAVTLACLWVLASGQTTVYDEVQALIQQGRSFKDVKLLQFESADVQNRDFQLEGLKKGVVLKLDHEAIQQLQRGTDELLSFKLPVSDRQDVTVNLIEHSIFTEDFAVYTSENGRTALNYRSGKHYKGVIDGQPNSLVAVSIFDNEIMGLITSANGNLVLGAITDDRDSRHLLYNDLDLDRKYDFDCGTVDDSKPYTSEELNFQADPRDVGDCVRVYIEIDDDIVTNKGGATPATNYITGLFNQSIVLYTAETVNMTISEIYAWVTNSPYSGSSSSAMLTSFQNNTGEFNGNIGHLVSYQASGGIAVLDNLCSSNPDWRKCFSSIDATYANVPTFSWSVMVITHEMGHVIGSKHTHACAWNGNNTAIDGCAGGVEGSCSNPGIPSGGGTIMSYCHLQNVGINFLLGFGPQPGNVIRSRVNAGSNCLTACGPPPPPPPPAYCSSNGNNSSYEWINKVVLGSINNTSGNNGGYHNYTSLSTNLTAGSAYSINLTPGFASASYNEYWRVWIDYNNDLDFNDAGEQVGQGSGTGAINVAFTVPAGTPTGNKRMRVSMKYNAYPTACEVFTYGEVEDYTVVIGSGGGGGATCSDGIQNQGETGIDCGGPCTPCATCNDGIQNQGESGVDCGGPCGACPPPPPPGNVVLSASYFETGWDSWTDGGSDVARVYHANAWEGNYAIRLTDNSGTQSAMTSPNYSMSGGTGAQIQFYFFASSFESGEDFWVRYSSNNGSTWTTIAAFTVGVNFNNNLFYVTTVTVPNFSPTTGKFRIQADASADNDYLYIDQVTITKLTGSSLPESGVVIEAVKDENPTIKPGHQLDEEGALEVYPNPASEYLNITFNREIGALRLTSIDGREFPVDSEAGEAKMLNIQHLVPGIYILSIESGGEWYPVRFSKM
jgi:hypothetical protein